LAVIKQASDLNNCSTVQSNTNQRGKTKEVATEPPHMMRFE